MMDYTIGKYLLFSPLLFLGPGGLAHGAVPGRNIKRNRLTKHKPCLRCKKEGREKVSNMEFKLLRKITMAFAFTLVAFPGCAPVVKTTMDSYLEKPEYYKGKRLYLPLIWKIF